MSLIVNLGMVDNTAVGNELMESTGKRHADTHVAWPRKATKNFKGLERMESKRESRPESEVMRE